MENRLFYMYQFQDLLALKALTPSAVSHRRHSVQLREMLTMADSDGT